MPKYNKVGLEKFNFWLILAAPVGTKMTWALVLCVVKVCIGDEVIYLFVSMYDQ